MIIKKNIKNSKITLNKTLKVTIYNIKNTGDSKSFMLNTKTTTNNISDGSAESAKNVASSLPDKRTKTCNSNSNKKDAVKKSNLKIWHHLLI